MIIAEGTWLTEGGYIVKLDSKLRAGIEHSPGLTTSRNNSKRLKKGWIWEKNGSIEGLMPEWCEKLKIVHKLDSEPKVPSGYKYVGDYPQIREVKVGEYYIALNGMASFSDHIKRLDEGSQLITSTVLGHKRLVVEPLASPETKSVPISLEIGKTYLTKGGYVVKISKTTHSGMFQGLKECSPGLNYANKTCEELGYNGWHWRKNGSIILNEEWADKLCIVKELPFDLPALSGYEWSGGYPQLREPEKGERYVSPYNKYDYVMCDGNTIDLAYLGKKRLIVTPLESAPKLKLGRIYTYNPLADISAVPEAPPNMATPNLAKRAASYFVVEPAKGTYRVAKESTGYIVFLGLLSVAGYSCYNPSGVATFVKSCVPHISVSVEKPEILK